jgi:hypothetical protein
VYLRVLCGSENRQRLFHCAALTAWFLGAFAKLRNMIFGFAMSVGESVRMEFGSHGTDFYENVYLSIFQKYV